MTTLVDGIFRKGKRFPEQVFQKQFNRFMYHDFYWTLSGDFWLELQKLAVNSMDESILVGVLEPDPENYFYREFKYYNWLELPVYLSVETYYDIIESFPKESPADALVYNSDIVFWFSPSGKWAIWGERYWECSVIGFKSTTNYKNLCSMLDSWHTFSEKINSDFTDSSYPQKFIDRFPSNYARNL